VASDNQQKNLRRDYYKFTIYCQYEYMSCLVVSLHLASARLARCADESTITSWQQAKWRDSHYIKHMFSRRRRRLWAYMYVLCDM